MKASRMLPFLFFLGLTQVAWGQIPRTISYQGVLRDATTGDLLDGAFAVQFLLWDRLEVPSSLLLWTETQSVVVTDGLFKVSLGSIAGFANVGLDFDQQYWLGIKVGADPEMIPRIPLEAAPYSLAAESVVGTGNVFPSSGNVGIGTTTPSTKLHVAGSIRIDNAYSYALTNSIGQGNNVLKAGPDDYTWLLPARSGFGTKFMNWDENLALMTIDDGGNVGIGTTTPATALDVSGTVTATSFAGDGSALTGLTASPWTLSGSNINYTAGNVGIGTTSPSDKLHIKAQPAELLTSLKLENLNLDGASRLHLQTDGSEYYYIQSVNADNSLQFRYYDGVSFLDRMRIDNAGNVGIGTTTPVDRLEVSGAIHTSGAAVASKANEMYMDFISQTGRLAVLGPDISTNASLEISSRRSDGTNKLVLLYGSSSGNVGIGTTSPLAPLHVSKDTEKLLKVYNPNLLDGAKATFRLGKADAANEALGIEYKQDAIASTVSMHFFGDNFGDSFVLQKGGNVGIGTTTPGARLEVLGTATNAGDILIKGTGTDIGMMINNTGAEGRSYALNASNNSSIQGAGKFQVLDVTAGVARLTIDSTGNVGIGTTSPGYALDVIGTVNATVFTGDGSALTGLTPSPWAIGGSDISYTAGKVGIGTTSGIAVLEVSSDASVNGQYYGMTDTNTGQRWFTGIISSTGGSYYIWDDTKNISRMVIDLSGNVGIGTTVPTAKLVVVGGVKADSILLTTPAERWYSIPAVEFRPAFTGFGYEQFFDSTYSTTQFSNVAFFAPVHLPHGATITEFQAVIADTTAFGNVTVELASVTFAGAKSNIHTLTSSFIGTMPYDSGTLSFPVDNETSKYMIRAEWQTPGFGFYQPKDVNIQGARVKYTVTSPLP